MSGFLRGARRARTAFPSAARRTILGLATVVLAGDPHTASAASPICANVALVLAIDTSGSIDAHEFDLQLNGLAAAFRHPDVQAALASAGEVAAAALFWGDSTRPVASSPWVRITGPEDAVAFAATLRMEAVRIGGDTGLGEGLDAALDLLQAPAACAARRIVNLSGDGKPSYGRFGRSDAAVWAARTRAEAQGATVNALAIRDVEPDLADYYRDHVLVGAGSFVMEVDRHEDFAAAIARKIAREVAPAMLARAD